MTSARDHHVKRVSTEKVNLIAAMCAITILGFAMGLIYPLLSLALERLGHSELMIGLSSAAQPVGTVLAIFTTTVFVNHFGARNVALVSAILTAAIVAIYPLVPDILSWTLMRAWQGFLYSMIYAVSEAWLIRYASGPHRARIISLYMSAFGASMALGPALIAAVGTESSLPFLVGAAVIAAAAIPILVVREKPARNELPGASSLMFLRRVPVLLASVWLFAMIDISNFSLLPVYGVQKGLGESGGAMMVMAFMLGPVILQFPIGWMADRFNKRAVLVGCTAGSALLIALIAPLTGTWAMWIVLPLAGAVCSGIYTVALAILGDKYSGNDLVGATTAVSAAYGLGSLGGSAISGFSMSALGPDWLIYVMALILLLLLAAIMAEAMFERAQAGLSLRIRTKTDGDGSGVPVAAALAREPMAGE